MGPCKVNDVQLPDGRTGTGMGVRVERCRYLEQAGCASVCLNSCKLPTQVRVQRRCAFARRLACHVLRGAAPGARMIAAAMQSAGRGGQMIPTNEQEFFAQGMGLPLTMTPNYDDFSCQFSFGVVPPPAVEDQAFLTTCFAQCPTAVGRQSTLDVCPGCQ